MATRLSAYLIILGFLLGNLFKIPLFRPDILVSTLDIAVIFLYLLTFRKIKFKINILSIFVFWLFLSLILNAALQNILSGLAYFLRYCLYVFSYLPLNILFSKSEKQTLITALAIMFPVFGVVQYFWFPDLRPFAIYGWDLHYFRVFGTYLDPGFFGLILFWSLLNIRNIYYWVFGYLVFAFTYSRSSFLAAVVGFRNITFMTLIILTLFLLPRSSSGEGVRLERTNSVVSRFDNWRDSLAIVQKHPLTGVGFNLLRFQFQDKKGWDISHAASGSDSSLVFVLVTSGIIGLILYLNILVRLWLFIKKNPKLNAFFLAIFVHSFFLNSQFYPPIILLFTLSLTVNSSL